MQLANARHYRNDGYPMLAIDVDGATADLMAECKPTVYRAGFVFLGPEFADRVPPHDLEIPAADGGGRIRLEGFTRDDRVYRLYTDFLRAAGDGTFAEGPVAIPA